VFGGWNGRLQKNDMFRFDFGERKEKKKTSQKRKKESWFRNSHEAGTPFLFVLGVCRNANVDGNRATRTIATSKMLAHSSGE
jgi:hypothetical protein